ncbi:MAG: hypothetical protein HQ591_03860 [candidate division Zixibacteria bacterium]|nr:hypothetical protein [Candidatus Tariuqbacter arcticus]
MSSREICQRVIEATDRFLADVSRHNIKGIRALVEERREILAELENIQEGNALKSNQLERIGKMRERIIEQEKSLEALVGRLQGDISEILKQMNRSKSILRKYGWRKRKPSLFIDRKR